MKTLEFVILALCLVVSLATIVDAEQQTLGTFKQYSCIDLLQTCSNCTYVNISSVTYPDSTQALGQASMTKVGTLYNKTFCSTSQLGQYIVNGYGDVDGANTIWSYNLYVTPAGGAESNTTFFIFLIVISASLVLLSFIFHNYIFAFFGGLSFMICGVYGMIYGYGDVTNLYTRMISYVLLGLGALIATLAGLDLLGDVEGKDNYNEEADD